MDRDQRNEISAQDQDVSEKSSRKANIISYILCVLAAIVIWLIVMNVNAPVNIPLGASEADAAALLSAICKI